MPVPLQIVVNVENASEAQNALARLRNETQETEQAVTSQSSTLGKLGDVYRTVMGVAAVGMVVKATAEMYQLGVATQAARRTFYNLGGSAQGLAALRESTHGLIDDMTLMQASSRFLGMGLAETTDQAAELADMGATLGMAFGMNASQSLGDFAALLANQSIPRLDNFGISSGRVRERIAALQTQTEGLSRETAFMQAVMEEARISMAKLGDQAGTQQGQQQTLVTSIQNLKAAMGELTAANMEAGGVIGVLRGAFDGLAQGIRASLQTGDQIKTFTANLDSQREAGALTEEQYKRMSDALGKLTTDLHYHVITAAQVPEKLREINAAAAGTITALDGVGAVVPEYTAAFENMLDALGPQSTAAAEMLGQNFAAIQANIAIGTQAAYEHSHGMQAALRDAFNSEEMQAALGRVGSIVASHHEELLSSQREWQASTLALDTEHHDQLLQSQELAGTRAGELAFHFQLAQTEARARFQAQYQTLQDAGATEEAAKLQAKFQQNQANDSVSYSRRQMIQRRALVMQEITRQKAYMTELKEQGAQIRRVLIAQIKKAYASEQITLEQEKQLLKIAGEGESERLQNEVLYAEQSAKVATALAGNNVKAAQTAVNALLAMQKGQLAAADDALAALEKQFDDLTNNILSGIRQTDFTGAFSGSISRGVDGMSSGMAKAKEAATKGLAEVSADIERGVSSAKKALADLMTMRIPAGVGQALDDMGEYLKLAVGKFYSWVPELKPKLADVELLLEPIIKLSGAISAANAALKSFSVGPEEFDLATWATRFYDAVSEMHGLIAKAKAELDPKLALSDAGEIADALRKIVSVLSIKLGVEAGEGDWAEQVTLFLARLRHASGVIYGWLQEIDQDTRTNLALAGPVADNIKRILALLTIKMGTIGAGGKLWADEFALWIARIQHASGMVYNWIQKIDTDTRAAVALAAPVADDVRKLLGLVNIKLDIDAGSALWADTFALWLRRLRHAGGMIYDWMQDIADDARANVALAAPVSENVRKLVSILAVKLDFASADYDWADKFQEWLRRIRHISGTIYNWMEEIGDDARANLALASPVAQDVQKLLALLSPKLDIDVGAKDWVEVFSVYIRRIQHASGMIYNWLNSIDSDTSASVKKAAGLAESVGKILKLTEFDLSKMKMGNALFATDIQAFIADLAFAVDELLIGIEGLGADLKDRLTAAAPLLEPLTQLLSLLNLSSVFSEMAGLKTMDLQGMVRDFGLQMEIAANLLIPTLDRIGTAHKDALKSAGETASIVQAAYGALGAISKSVQDAAELGGIDVAAAQAMVRQLGVLSVWDELPEITAQMRSASGYFEELGRSGESIARAYTSFGSTVEAISNVRKWGFNVDAAKQLLRQVNDFATWSELEQIATNLEAAATSLGAISNVGVLLSQIFNSVEHTVTSLQSALAAGGIDLTEARNLMAELQALAMQIASMEFPAPRTAGQFTPGPPSGPLGAGTPQTPPKVQIDMTLAGTLESPELGMVFEILDEHASVLAAWGERMAVQFKPHAAAKSV